MGTAPTSNPKVEGILEQLLASREFSRSGQLKKILAYVCRAAAEGRQDEVTESAIAEEVLNRRNFDPNADTIVRVQMRRLKQKLNEYYANEGAHDLLRVEFRKHSYVPAFRENWREEPGQRKQLRLPPGFLYGLLTATVLALAIVTWLEAGHAKRPHISREVLRSPLERIRWPFGSSPDRDLYPLFFRSAEGFVRNARLNFAEDLPYQKELLPKDFAWPLWDSWVNIHNIQAALYAANIFGAIETTPIIESARHVNLEKLRGHAVLFLGHPRGAETLVDLLSSLNFYVDRSSSAQSLDGFSNRSPRADELPHYQRSGGEAIHNLNLSGSDYALITLIRDDGGSPILSLFGDYCDTPYFLVKRLTEPDFVRGLEDRVFGPTVPDFRYCQIVFKVQYLNSEPMEAEYVTHRLIGRNGTEVPAKGISSREIHSFLLPGLRVAGIR